MMEGGLSSSDKEIFCQEYVIDRNISRAARVAGVSPAVGASWVKRLDVQVRLEVLRRQTLERIKVTRDRVFNEVAALAFGDPSVILSENYALKPLDGKRRKEVGPLIKSVRHDRFGNPNITFHSKTPALLKLVELLRLEDFSTEDERETEYNITFI